MRERSFFMSFGIQWTHRDGRTTGLRGYGDGYLDFMPFRTRREASKECTQVTRALAEKCRVLTPPLEPPYVYEVIEEGK